MAPGNIHDSVMFEGLYKKVMACYPQAEMIDIDSEYIAPWSMKQVFDSGRLPETPCKQQMTKQGFFKSMNMSMMNITAAE